MVRNYRVHIVGANELIYACVASRLRMSCMCIVFLQVCFNFVRALSYKICIFINRDGKYELCDEITM